MTIADFGLLMERGRIRPSVTSKINIPQSSIGIPSTAAITSDLCDGFEAGDGRAGFVRFFPIEGEVKGPVVEVVEGLAELRKSRLRQFLKILEIFWPPWAGETFLSAQACAVARGSLSIRLL